MSFATGLITNTIPCWLISVKNRSPSSENVMCLVTQQSRNLVLANHNPAWVWIQRSRSECQGRDIRFGQAPLFLGGSDGPTMRSRDEPRLDRSHSHTPTWLFGPSARMATVP